MGWRDRWRFILRAARSTPVEPFSAAPTPVDDVIRASGVALQTLGPVPTRELALQIPAVLRGRNLICSIATLPLVQTDASNVRTPHPLLRQIDPHVPNLVTVAQTVEDLLFDGISWWRVLARGWDDFPTSAQRLDVDSVSLVPPPGWRDQHLPSGVDPESVVWVDGRPVNGRDMIRFDSPQPGLLKAARRAIRRAAKLEQAAERYADDPKALEYFTPAEGADPAGDDKIEKLLDDWQEARRDRAPAYVPAALEHHEINWMSPADLQLAELQKRAALDIANAIGLDPEDLGISTTSRTYQNATDRRRDRINDVLSVYMQAISGRLSMDDVTKRGYAVGFDLAEFLRADPKTLAEVEQIHLGMGTITREEIRQEQGRPPLPAGSEQPRQDEGGQAAEEGTVRNNVTPLRQLAFSGGGGGEVRVAFAAADPDVQHFRVDAEQRTIRGLAVPYNVTATNGWASWRFLPGSLSWSSPGRVKFLLEHNPRSTLGVAVELTDTDEGLAAAFRVGQGQARDEALSDAADGILDGLSIGVTIHEDGLTYDKKEGAYVVSKATLREISLCSIPAFDDARLTSVAASWNGGTDMRCPLCGGDHAAGTPCSAPAVTTLSAPTTTAPAQFDMAAFAAQLQQTVQQAATSAAQAAVQAAGQGEGPAVVNPRQPGTAQLNVREQPMYRFDGYMGQHDFSTDLFAWAKAKGNAPEQQERLERFAERTFGAPRGAIGFADVSTDDVNELSPTTNRPDLYVDQLEYAYPIWSAISKGAVLDATPFTIPKFSSASGLVADHTEGTEPTGGAFVTTGQTITPVAVSGKVEVTRETIDQGGNPQTSTLIWRQIVRAYFEALEARAVAMLEALTPTAIALTAGVVDADLDGEITAAFAGLQFARGGFRMRDLFLNQALFTAISQAVDDNGRKLYPMIVPQNASGSTAEDFAYIMIGSLRARPAWALATSTTAEESSYLFSREDCHGWASTPRKLNFEYQVKSVEIGVWGYAVAANTRLDGVREITYDPQA